MSGNSNRTETVRVEQSRPLERLDTFLRGRYPAMSRGAIQRLIEEGHIRVDGRVVKPTHRPHAGEEISVHWPAAKPLKLEAEELPLDILYEDDDLLVLNKAPGVVVHPAAGHNEHTLVHALLHHCAGGLSGIGGVARPGIVHRLDKDTSGCLVAAKNDAAHLGLAEQFAGRQVEKVYHALVCGAPAARTGEIRAAIARHPSHRKRMAVTDGSGGREAWTSYRVLEAFGGASLVEARLHTGRTHQIRVHLQHLGHPLVGDESYGAKQNRRLREWSGGRFGRQMLHAWRLVFAHPRKLERMKFEAPRPGDFAEALELFRELARIGE